MTTVGEIEKQIFETEGFNVRFCNNGRKVRSDCSTALVYPYKNAGYATWTVKQWKETRMAPYLQDHEIEVLEFDGNPAAGNRTLKRLREQYPVTKQQPPKTSDTPNLQTELESPAKTSSDTLKPLDDHRASEALVRQISSAFPSLVYAKGTSVCAIEIDVDSLQKVDEYRCGGWEDLLKKITAQWVQENSYADKGTIWDWGTQSVNFGHQGYSRFYAVTGMPAKFRKHLGNELVRILGSTHVRSDSDYVTPKQSEGWRAVCHIEEGKTWKIWDASAWEEVCI